jgi:hypothetical protein
MLTADKYCGQDVAATVPHTYNHPIYATTSCSFTGMGRRSSSSQKASQRCHCISRFRIVDGFHEWCHMSSPAAAPPPLGLHPANKERPAPKLNAVLVTSRPRNLLESWSTGRFQLPRTRPASLTSDHLRSPTETRQSPPASFEDPSPPRLLPPSRHHQHPRCRFQAEVS